MADISSTPDPIRELRSNILANDAFDILANTSQLITEIGSKEVFQQVNIVEENWNRVFPYQLQILDASLGYIPHLGLTYTLPIPPQDISVSMPFASNAIATFGGIVEENSGAPFRMITFRATTGVTPARPTTRGLGASSLVNAIFAGTLSGVGEVGRSINQLVNAISGAPNLSPAIGIIDGDIPLHTTGYYQFHLLKKFLEYYASIRKTDKGKNLRLALARYKDGEAYICTPSKFDYVQSSSSPMRIDYTLSLKAWARIPAVLNGLPAGKSFQTLTVSPRDPNLLADIMGKIQEARNVLQGVKDIIQGFRGDVNNTLFEPLRETAFFCKDAVGVGITAGDLPTALLKDYQSSVLDSWGTFSASLDLARNSNFDPSSTFDAIQQSSNDQKVAAYVDPPIHGAVGVGGSASVAHGAAPIRQAMTASDPVNKIFDDPDKYANLFNQIQVTTLNTSPANALALQAERERVRNFGTVYFETVRDNIQELAADIADAVGLGDSTYSSTYGRPTAVQKKLPTVDDYEILYQLNALAVSYDALAINSSITKRSAIPSAINYVAGLAQQSGTAFQIPTSKFAVPFPYGSTLERLALTYLGDANRWQEIVVLNGLHQPYVDEVGFDLFLLSNGNGNEIFVSDATNLFINQAVWISSTTMATQVRNIQNLTKIDDNSWLVTLDGTNNLSQYTVAAQAKIHAYLPGTVNSQKVIYIPSAQNPDEDPALKAIPGVNDFDNLLNVGGIDLLLNQNNDLIIAPDGSSPYAFGLSNLIQVARIAVSTKQGALLQHPEYGINLGVGDSNADSTAKDLLKAVTAMFSQDSRFAKVYSVSVSKAGPTTTISISLGVRGTNHILPLSIQIPD